MEYIYDNPSFPPQESAHWKSLPHQEGDRCLANLEQLRDELLRQTQTMGDVPPPSLQEEIPVALWSALLGYCEALCTGKERYDPYPIPIDALQRLVSQEFTPSVTEHGDDHRQAARNLSNWVWEKVISKSNVRDEKHANSLYTVLRGRIDNKSVDCFGAALVTVMALRQNGYPSILSLSEDHAYESHGDNDETCEVAIPGNTKSQKQKRGQDIAETLKKRELTPATSWLYMAGNAVLCDTPAKLLAAALANINCLIESKSNYEKYSRPLLIMKRELLWILKDGGKLDCFPFAMCELGWAEEHATSSRGEVRLNIPWESSNIEVTAIEALYHEAVASSKTNFHDKQVYPYCYLGFFHKDGGQEEEYRLSLALQFFAQAARVASTYKYESGDTLQLTKVFTKVSEFVVNEILCFENKARSWKDAKNAITVGKWLIVFFGYLFLWEEQSGGDSFLPICKSNHKTGIARSFVHLYTDVRKQAFQIATVNSHRFQNGQLRSALESNKPSISEMHLTIVSDTKRSRKRKKFS